MPLYIAIDQGGSKTEALLLNERGEILARGDDRDIRFPETYSEYQRNQGSYMARALETALRNSKIDRLTCVEGVVCALNGADWPHDYVRLKSVAAEAFNIAPEKVKIVNDCIGAMRGGTDEARKAIICIGTGLNIAVCNGEEQIIYGYYIADKDQGGGALGREAWRAVIDAETGLGAPTQLTELVLQKYGKPDLERLYIAFTDGEMIREDRDLAPLVTAAAANGDKVANEIIDAMAARLAAYVSCGMKKLGISGMGIHVVLSGGVTKGDGYVLMNAISRHLAAHEQNAVCAHAVYEPVAGTALIALDDVYMGRLPECVAQNFSKTAKAHGLLLSEN